jgi:hypothetical protein
MNICKSLGLGLAMVVLGAAASSVQAKGLGAEGNYGRAQGGWGGELGAGYAFDLGAFSLTPSAGVYLRDGDTDLYGRVEGVFHLPASASIGAGLRFGNDTRPYATIAMPLLPKVAVKANVGPKYYTIGIKLGY